MPGTTPLCQEHAIKQEIKQGSKGRKKKKQLPSTPHFSEELILRCARAHAHAHTARRYPSLGPGRLSTWCPSALSPPQSQPEPRTVDGDIFKAMTQRSVTHSVFSVGGERAVSCCSCHPAQHYKCALRHYSEKVRQPDPAQRVPADTVQGKGVWGQALLC